MIRRGLLAATSLLIIAAPAAFADHTESDYVASDNVTKIGSDRLPGDGVGARVVGPYLYVTSTKGLTIYDIKTDPEHPKKLGNETMDVEFENEEVPTNGKVLGISGQIGCADPGTNNVFSGTAPKQVDPNSTWSASETTGCLTLWDVTNPAAPTKIKSVLGAGEHTTACAYDCQWLYGSTGAITDNRDPKNARLVGNWQTNAFPGEGSSHFKSTCHHLREIQPGILLGSCQPIVLLSLRAEDGGSPLKPVVIATGVNAGDETRFIHSSQWPNHGTDKFMLAGGETNGQPACDDTVGAFMVWDATGVRDGKGGFVKGGTFKELSEVRPTSGTYSDGHSPYNGLGCSVHWFEQHPSFHDGGLVALAEYENGTRFLQITDTGKIVEQGFFLPLGGSTSAPHWNPYNPQILYVVDYARGLDILKYTGPTFVPPQPAAPATKGSSTTKHKKKKHKSKAKHHKKHKKHGKKHKKKHHRRS